MRLSGRYRGPPPPRGPRGRGPPGMRPPNYPARYPQQTSDRPPGAQPGMPSFLPPGQVSKNFEAYESERSFVFSRISLYKLKVMFYYFTKGELNVPLENWYPLLLA